MSLCLSANAPRSIEPAAAAGLGERLRRVLLAFAPVDRETGDLMPAPVIDAAVKARRRRTARHDEVNALLL